MYHHIHFVLIKSGNLRNASCHLLTTVFFVFYVGGVHPHTLCAKFPTFGSNCKYFCNFFTIFLLTSYIAGFPPPNTVLSLA